MSNNTNTIAKVSPVKSLGPSARKVWATLTNDQRVAANAAIAAGTKPSIAMAQVEILASTDTLEVVIEKSAKVAKAAKAPVKKVTAPLNSSTSRRDLLLVVKGDEPVTADNLLDAVHAGTVTFYKVRENGSLRNWPILTGKARKAAEKIAAAHEGGEKIADIAKKAHTSVPTIRRAITALNFTIEIESLTAKEAKAIIKNSK
jgi:hypothetical protein